LPHYYRLFAKCQLNLLHLLHLHLIDLNLQQQHRQRRPWLKLKPQKMKFHPRLQL
jgi:hypothetical protein